MSKHPPTAEATAATTTSPQNPAAASTGTDGPEIVESEEKKKKKYSSGLSRTVSEVESGVTKSARKLAKAVREGLDDYQERRDESSKKEKDGVLRDFLRNQSKSLRKGLPIAAEAPLEILDAVVDLKVVRRLTNPRKLFRN